MIVASPVLAAWPTPLYALVKAAGRDLLPWLLEHAPDGDADAAIRRAWDAAPDPVWMRQLCAAAGRVIYTGALFAEGYSCTPRCCYMHCHACMAVVRERGCPTLAELTAARPP